MAYAFEKETSLGRLRRYCSQAIGGLEARESLKDQAADWRTFQARILALRAEREGADDRALFADAKVRVEDADFDVAVIALSGKSWFVSGRKKGKEPHATLFAKLSADDITRLGVAKAKGEGARLVKQGKALALPELEPEVTALAARTDALTAAGAAVEAADDGLFAPRQAKNALIRDLNTLIATTEAAILTAFPGRRDLVSAILTPWFERRTRRAKDEPAPAPAPADGDDTEDDDEEL